MKADMVTEVAKIIIEALRESLLVQVEVPVDVISITSIAATAPRPGQAADVISAMGIAGTGLSGTLALCFPSATLLGLLNKMLGESYEAVTVENSDLAGELLNITYASARVKLNALGCEFSPSLPTTTLGAAVKLSYRGALPVIRVGCRCTFGEFSMEIQLQAGGKPK